MPLRFSHNHQSPTATAQPGSWRWEEEPGASGCGGQRGPGLQGFHRDSGTRASTGRHTRLTCTETQRKQTPRERGPVTTGCLERASGHTRTLGEGPRDALEAAVCTEAWPGQRFQHRDTSGRMTGERTARWRQAG